MVGRVCNGLLETDLAFQLLDPLFKAIVDPSRLLNDGLESVYRLVFLLALLLQYLLVP